MQLNLIWTQSPQSLSETNWIRWLLQDLEVKEYVSPGLDCVRDNSIYILSGNSHPLYQLPSRFLDQIRSAHGKGLFHLSDESFSGGYEVYDSFDFVLRNYYSAFLHRPSINILPLGPTNDLGSMIPVRPATERTLLWSFAGAKTAARMEMFNSLKTLHPHQSYFVDTRKQVKPRLDREAFMRLLSDSVFSPCPMGNVVLETFRTYESLEMGCIPILERRNLMPYYDLLMPGHPLPSFASWAKANEFIRTLSKSESRLIDYQNTISEWWFSYKERIRNDMNLFIRRGLQGSYHPSLNFGWRGRPGMKYQTWRIIELLRHASRASLQERISIIARQAIGRLAFGGREGT